MEFPGHESGGLLSRVTWATFIESRLASFTDSFMQVPGSPSHIYSYDILFHFFPSHLLTVAMYQTLFYSIASFSSQKGINNLFKVPKLINGQDWDLNPGNVAIEVIFLSTKLFYLLCRVFFKCNF